MSVTAITDGARRSARRRSHLSAASPVGAGVEAVHGAVSAVEPILDVVPGTVPAPETETETETVRVTISLDLRGVEDRERVLRALRELVLAGGQGAELLPPVVALRDDVVAAAAPRRDPDRPLEIRPGTRTVVRGDLPVQLSRLEYDLLLFFVRHPNRVFTRHQLLTHVWGHTFAGARTVDVHIRRLRMKLELARPLVTTVHGVGYRLADDPPVRLHDAS